MRGACVEGSLVSGQRGFRQAVSPAIGLAILAALASTAFAQETPLSLVQALELASQRNPELLARRARTEAEAARTQLAKRAIWPRVSLSSGWMRSDTPATVFAGKLNAREFTQDDFAIDRLNFPGGLSHLTTILIAEFPVDISGKVKARAAGQSSAEAAAAAALDEAVQELRLRVVEAYRRAALAQRVAEIAERALGSAKAREADVEARVAEGDALAADLLRTRARRRQREAELGERRADAEIAIASLSRLLGADESAAYRPTEFPPPPAPLQNDQTSWIDRASRERPSLRTARERASGQGWVVRAEERANRPDLLAFGQIQDDRNGISSGGRSGAVGISLRWNAFDPTRGKRIAAAAADARAVELEARAAQDDVRLEVETAWRRAQAARERYAAAQGGAAEGREALRVVHERRQHGMATLTDELETEAASLAAELEELRAASDAALADAALLRAVGAL